jgi:hypothetical protein
MARVGSFMLSDTVNGVLEVSLYDDCKNGRQEQRQNFIQLLSGEGAESIETPRNCGIV